jgi:hypothetical protein
MKAFFKTYTVAITAVVAFNNSGFAGEHETLALPPHSFRMNIGLISEFVLDQSN